MRKYVSNQTGRSMIEMLGVLAIVGVLSVAGIAGYSKAMAKYKTNKLIDQVSTIVANTKTKFVAQGNYKGLSTDAAWKLGIFPEEVSKQCDADGKWTSSCLRNAFGGSLYLNAQGDNNFYISVLDISKDTCSSLITTDWGSSSGFVGLLNLSNEEQKNMNAVEKVTRTCSCKNNESTCAVHLIFK